MGLFDKFFSGNQEMPDESAHEAERLEEKQKLIFELGSLNLSRDAIEALSPDEVHDLHQKIANLLMQLQTVSRPERDAANVAVVPADASIISASTEEDVLNLTELQSEAVKTFYRQLFDDMLLDCLVAEKFREYQMDHWQETFQKELAKGKTPFGDGTDFYVNFYQNLGIDIVNPMPLDIEAFFQRREYTGGAITAELDRRRGEKYKLSEQDQANVYELFWKLFRVPDGKGWFNTLKDREFKKKLLEIKTKLPWL